MSSTSGSDSDVDVERVRSDAPGHDPDWRGSVSVTPGPRPSRPKRARNPTQWYQPADYSNGRTKKEASPEPPPPKFRRGDMDENPNAPIELVISDELEGLSQEELAVGLVDVTENRYMIEKIINYRIMKRKEEYFVKWEGWPDKWNNWEEGENMDDCSQLKEEFFSRRPAFYQAYMEHNYGDGPGVEEFNPFDNDPGSPEVLLQSRVLTCVFRYKEFKVLTAEEIGDRVPVAIFGVQYDAQVDEEPAYLMQLDPVPEGQEAQGYFVMHSVGIALFPAYIQVYLHDQQNVTFPHPEFNVHHNLGENPQFYHNGVLLTKSLLP